MNTKAIDTLPGFSTLEHGSASAARQARRLQPIAGTALACLLIGGMVPATSGQFQYQRLKSFGFLELSSGNYPSEVIEASDGKLYGTTSGGGTKNAGTVFKLNRDGSGYTVVHTFSRSGSDGANPGTGFDPSAGLVEGSDGVLYGTTISGGGTNDAGTVFKLNKDGTGYTVLHRFAGPGWDAQYTSALTIGSDGALYGTDGTVFKIHPDGTGFRVLHSFSADEGTSFAPLVEGSDGALYATAFSGGLNITTLTAGMGTVYKLNKDGTGFTVLHRFTGTAGDGRNPTGALVKGSDGVLYGTTAWGGTNDRGTVFKLNKDGTGYTILHGFTGRAPGATLVAGSNGELYGMTFGGGTNDHGTLFKLDKDGTSYMVLHNFAFNTDNPQPRGLLIGSDGALYGSTTHGGANHAGSVVKLNQDGSGYVVLHDWSIGERFTEPWVSAGLIEASDGRLYGTTFDREYLGAVFSLNKDGTDYRIVHRLDSGYPVSGLLQGSDGALYGTTLGGGDLSLGTVFVLHPQPVMLPPVLSAGEVTVRFTSMPGSTHRIQRTSTLGGSWQTLANTVVPTNSVAQFIDPAQPQSAAWYRTIAP